MVYNKMQRYEIWNDNTWEEPSEIKWYEMGRNKRVGMPLGEGGGGRRNKERKNNIRNYHAW